MESTDLYGGADEQQNFLIKLCLFSKINIVTNTSRTSLFVIMLTFKYKQNKCDPLYVNTTIPPVTLP